MGKWEWGFCRFYLLFVTERLQLVLSSKPAGMRSVEARLGGSNLWLHCRCSGLQTACFCGCQRGEKGQWFLRQRGTWIGLPGARLNRTQRVCKAQGSGL